MLHRQKQTRMSKHIIYNVTQTKTNENVKAHNIQCYTDKNKRECQSTMLHRQKQTRISKHIIYNVTQTKTNENVKAHNIQCYTDKNKRECQST